MHPSEEPRTFPNPGEMLTAEYEYQEKQPFSIKVGSSDICIIEKAAI